MTIQDDVDVPTLVRPLVLPRQRDVSPAVQLDGPATFDCCGVSIAAVDTAMAVTTLRGRARARIPTGVHLCNAYTLKLATRSAAYTDVLNTGDVNLPDGAPVAWAARRAGHANVTEPVRGPGLFDAVLADGLSWGARHYFYGSTPEVLEQLERKLRERHPGLQVAGLESPPFRPLGHEERRATRERIAAIGAHYVWIGLGTPKQDWFVADVASHLPSVTVAIGAAFDFAAGTLREAPPAWHGSGFEWLYRLATEPRRLAGRYLRTATVIPAIMQWRPL